MANKYDTVTTKVVPFKTLRDGALLLDKDDRVLFVKAMQIDMGDTGFSAKMIQRMADNGYDKQFNFIKVADPRWSGITMVEEWIKKGKVLWKDLMLKLK